MSLNNKENMFKITLSFILFTFLFLFLIVFICNILMNKVPLNFIENYNNKDKKLRS